MIKKETVIKIIYILITIAVVITIFSNYVYGISIPDNLSDIYTGSDTTISNIGSQVIYVAQIGLFAAGVIALMVAGLSYMFAAPEGKAEIKKKMIYLAIGAVLLFAAGGIVSIVGTIAMNISD